MVTSYRYFDDITVFSIIDLETGAWSETPGAQHLHTPLSDDEFDEAQTLAREKATKSNSFTSDSARHMRVNAQFSQYNSRTTHGSIGSCT